jgi:N-ethylmaleimide reductase
MSLLFAKTTLGSLTLQNHLVMAPMTRSRAIGNIPNELMAEYYAQRGSAGLIITEGTSPSPNGLGYPRIPGIFSAGQVAGWKRITDAVHAKGAKKFIQFMHCGRIGHALNLPAGARILAPSAVMASGEMYTDAEGMKPHPIPQAMTETDIKTAIEEFAQAAKNAMAAGFDGIELHGANGYLLEQFIRPNSNQRSDRYGGSIENRTRFVLEVADAVIKVIGKDKVGIRLSPFGVFNDMPLYDAMEADYTYLAQQLNARGLAYIHLVDHSSMGAPPVPASMKATLHNVFKGKLILSGGYDATRAESDLAAGKCDLVAVGKPFLANPDLVTRWKTGAALNRFSG